MVKILFTTNEDQYASLHITVQLVELRLVYPGYQHLLFKEKV